MICDLPRTKPMFSIAFTMFTFLTVYMQYTCCIYIGTSGVPIQGFGYLQGNDGNIRSEL